MPNPTPHPVSLDQAYENESEEQHYLRPVPEEAVKDSEEDVIMSNVGDLPNKNVLQPTKAHPAHVLTEGMLLCSQAIFNDRACYICRTCYNCMGRNTMPALSLANGMWIGDVPYELARLTLPEQILIARYHSAAYVIKMLPKKRGPEPLAATMAIAFVGPKGKPIRGLPKLLHVRKICLLQALTWLKANNPLYADIVVCQDRLAMFPEEGVPDALRSVVRFSDDEELFEREHGSYLASEYMPESEGRAGNVTFLHSAIPECETEMPGLTARISLWTISLTQSSMLGALDIPEEDIMAHALANTDDPPVSDFVMRRSSTFVSEYPRIEKETGMRTDGGPSNANHLLGAFPTSFPYGLGGFEVDRVRPEKTYTVLFPSVRSHTKEREWEESIGDQASEKRRVRSAPCILSHFPASLCLTSQSQVMSSERDLLKLLRIEEQLKIVSENERMAEKALLNVCNQKVKAREMAETSQKMRMST
ncbi:hypothetical protein FPV67DRAFT_1449245 [Lyophyllum atratum]|nr:hypothetical protein FPV67DRAFT_1449245 [Lyophyllum atratum]